MRRQPEKHEQAQIVKALKALGAAVYVLGTRRRQGDHQGTCQTHGLPDLVCFVPRAGQVWIEVKVTGGRLTPAQRVFALQCEQASVSHVVGGLDAVRRWLESRGVIRVERTAKLAKPPTSGWERLADGDPARS